MATAAATKARNAQAAKEAAAEQAKREAAEKEAQKSSRESRLLSRSNSMTAISKTHKGKITHKASRVSLPAIKSTRKTTVSMTKTSTPAASRRKSLPSRFQKPRALSPEAPSTSKVKAKKQQERSPSPMDVDEDSEDFTPNITPASLRSGAKKTLTQTTLPFKPVSESASASTSASASASRSPKKTLVRKALTSPKKMVTSQKENAAPGKLVSSTKTTASSSKRTAKASTRKSLSSRAHDTALEGADESVLSSSPDNEPSSSCATGSTAEPVPNSASKKRSKAKVATPAPAPAPELSSEPAAEPEPAVLTDRNDTNTDAAANDDEDNAWNTESEIDPYEVPDSEEDDDFRPTKRTKLSVRDSWRTGQTGLNVEVGGRNKTKNVGVSFERKNVVVPMPDPKVVAARKAAKLEAGRQATKAARLAKMRKLEEKREARIRALEQKRVARVKGTGPRGIGRKKVNAVV